MMLDHDGQKMKIAAHCLYLVFDEETQRIQREFGALCFENSKYREPAHCFVLDGKVYTDGDRRAFREKKQPLHPTLLDRGRKAAQDQDRLKADRSYLTTFLNQTLGACQTVQDMRDALPNVLAEQVTPQGLNQLPRVKPEGFQFLDGRMKTYTAARDLIFRYLADKLVL
jgi:hypothetical protein